MRIYRKHARIIEHMIPKLLEGVDLKEFLPRLLRILWKEAGTGEIEDNRSILDTMSRIASETGGKITESIPSKIKKIL